MDTTVTYISLTAANFKQEVLESGRPVFVEFTADWCGSSHIMIPAINDMAVKFKDSVTFCRLNVDEHEEIAREYSVEHIPTMLLFRDGQVVDAITGTVPKSILTRKLNELLQRHDE